MKKNNKNWNVCAELLNKIAKNAEWDKAKIGRYNVMIETVTDRVKKTTEENGFNTPKQYEMFTDFYGTLYGRLYNKLEKYWLNGRLTDGEFMSDDSFMDFLEEILGHGYDAYCEIMEDWTVAKKYVDIYVENFGYCLQFMYKHKMIEDREILVD